MCKCFVTFAEVERAFAGSSLAQGKMRAFQDGREETGHVPFPPDVLTQKNLEMASSAL